jgi:hypothetical protein
MQIFSTASVVGYMALLVCNLNNIEYLRKRLSGELSYAYRIFGLSVILGIILMGILLYCVLQISKVIIYHRTRLKEQRAKQQGAMQKLQGSNAVYDAKNDDEFYPPVKDAQDKLSSKDDYQEFQDNINKEMSTYKDYNQKLQDYFKKKCDSDAPDQYDKRVLLPDNDEW